MNNSNTTSFVKNMKHQADRASGWFGDRLDQAPDMEDVREAVSDTSRKTVEAARDRIDDFGKWLADLAEDMGVVEPPKSSKANKAAGVAAIGAAAAGGWYFFNSTTGKQHRSRVRDYLVGLRDRIMGRLKDSEVFADQSGDLVTVDPQEITGIEGLSVNS